MLTSYVMLLLLLASCFFFFFLARCWRLYKGILTTAQGRDQLIFIFMLGRQNEVFSRIVSRGFFFLHKGTKNCLAGINPHHWMMMIHGSVQQVVVVWRIQSSSVGHLGGRGFEYVQNGRMSNGILRLDHEMLPWNSC